MGRLLCTFDGFAQSRTSETSWVKRTTQGHGKCLGQSRMGRVLYAFVKMHKDSLEKPPFIDRLTCRRAGIPIVKAIIMQFTILSHKSSVVKGFLQIFLIFFEFDQNRQSPTRGHGEGAAMRTVRKSRRPQHGKIRAAGRIPQYIHTLFPNFPQRTCLQIEKNMVYYYNL